MTTGTFLANDKCRKHCSKYFNRTPDKGTLNESLSGPALSLKMDGFEGLDKTDQDCVVSLPCECKRI